MYPSEMIKQITNLVQASWQPSQNGAGITPFILRIDIWPLEKRADHSVITFPLPSKFCCVVNCRSAELFEDDSDKPRPISRWIERLDFTDEIPKVARLMHIERTVRKLIACIYDWAFAKALETV